VIEVHGQIAKWKVIIMGRDGPHGFCGKKALNHLIHCQLSKVCGEKAPAHSTLCSWVQSFSSGKETAQAAVHEWHRNTAKEWFCEAIAKS
jgi:hypothetical protein